MKGAVYAMAPDELSLPAPRVVLSIPDVLEGANYAVGVLLPENLGAPVETLGAPVDNLDVFVENDSSDLDSEDYEECADRGGCCRCCFRVIVFL